MSIRLDQLPTGADALARRVAAIEKTLRERAAQLGDVLRRTDATVAMLVGTRWQLLDRSGTAVVAEDVSGDGLAMPYLPITWAPARYTDWPASTSGTFEDIHRATIKRLQPYAYVVIGHTSDAGGTAGEVRLTVNGVVTGATTAVTFGQAAVTVGPFAMPGSLKSQVELRVQARRTAGAGAIRCAVLAASGIES